MSVLVIGSAIGDINISGAGLDGTGRSREKGPNKYTFRGSSQRNVSPPDPHGAPSPLRTARRIGIAVKRRLALRIHACFPFLFDFLICSSLNKFPVKLGPLYYLEQKTSPTPNDCVQIMASFL